MTSTKSLPLKQPIILLVKVSESQRRQKSVLFRYDRGVKTRSCSNEIGASKGGLVQMR